MSFQWSIYYVQAYNLITIYTITIQYENLEVRFSGQ